jgi:hypothetical protein
MIGVSFDPAQEGQYNQQGSGPNASSAPRGIQEAIKILSLRLPRVVGANAVSPQALLGSPGSAGSRVDSVVNQIMARYFPQGVTQPQAPFSPGGGSNQQMPFQSPQTFLPPSGGTTIGGKTPSVKVGNPNAPQGPTQIPGPGQGNPYESITFTPPPFPQQPPLPPAFDPPQEPMPWI